MTIPPKTVKVGPYRYSISVDKDFNYQNDFDKKSTDDGYMFGGTNHPTQSIVLDGRVGPDLQGETLLHEVIHCCLFALGSPDWSDEDDLEERICMSLSPILFDTLRSNPELVDYLFNKGGE